MLARPNFCSGNRDGSRAERVICIVMLYIYEFGPPASQRDRQSIARSAFPTRRGSASREDEYRRHNPRLDDIVAGSPRTRGVEVGVDNDDKCIWAKSRC